MFGVLDGDHDGAVVHRKLSWCCWVVVIVVIIVRTARRLTVFNELLDYDYDDQRWKFQFQEDEEEQVDEDQQKDHHRSTRTAIGFCCLFGGAWGHTTIAIVTAILIGLFIELRNCLVSMSTQGDPSTSGGGPDRPCGITSLLPVGMSCRGRAEAFARSLQSRLRTLGAQGNADDEVPITGGGGGGSSSSGVGYNAENTWLSQEESAAVTSSQPVRLVTNEAADSCFDFDMENESPGSPVEECEYTRLIETATATPAEIAPESGYVCASPCSTPQVSQEEHSPSSTGSSDCQFYDPVESSDAEQRCDYYDCTTSEPSSGSLSAAAIARPSTVTSSRTQHHHNTTSTSTESTATTAMEAPVVGEPTSSPTSSRRKKQHQNGHLPSGLGTTAADSDSCSESLPPSQSTESHDSTFTGLSSNNSNSTLQDVTLEGLMEETTVPVGVDETDDGKVLANGHAVMPKGTIMHEESTVAKFELNQTYNIDVLKFINGDAEEEPDEEDPNSPKVEMAEVEKMLQEAEQKEVTSSSEHKREGLSSGDEDEDFCRPQRIRRCSSLKTGKTPPGTPGRKKIVRFADVLGLDLADVKTFVDEVPKVPKSAYEDLEINIEPVQTQICLGPRADRVLVPLFQQPGALPCFLDRVREKQVNLENAAVTDPINLTITGTVRVRNLDFHKSVYLRYTTDNWRSFSDLQASYVDNSCDGFSDKFTFTIYGTSVQIGQRIEMAVRFHCRGQQFWDNNYDTNYVFQCLPITQPNNLALPSVKPANLNDALLSPDDAWCKSFY